MFTGRTLLGAALAAGCLAAPGLAQIDPAGPAPGGGEQLQREARLRELQQMNLDTRLRANAAVPPGQRLLLDYGAFVNFNYLDLDDPSGDNHVLRESDLVGYARLNFDGAHELFLRGRVGWRDFNEGDSFDGRGDEPVDGDLERGYYRFDLRRYRAAYGDPGAGGGDLTLVAQGGRDLVYWGNGLVLAQVLDGGILNLGTPGDRLSLELIAGVTPVRTVDFDTSRPAFDYNTRRGFFGAMASAAVGESRPFVYALAQRDLNQEDFRRIGAIETRYDYNSYYFGVGSTGAIGNRLRYGVEAAYEGGNTLSNSFELVGFGLVPVEQTRNYISAAAANARLDYLFEDPGQTRLGVELTAASGDRDRGHTSNTLNGNRRNSGDHAFNAFGLLNTGLAFAPDVSNLLAFRAGVATSPFPEFGALRRLQIGADVFAFGKLAREAPIDEPTREQRFLGFEPDVYLNWQVTSDVTLALRYGVFFPSADAFANDDPRHFFFAGVTFAF